VWIDKNGFVKAITESEYVSVKNIEAFINGRTLNLPVRKEIEYDFTKPLFVNGNGGSNENYIFRSILTGYLDGFQSSGGMFTNDSGKVIRFLQINTSILYLYRHAFKELGQFPDNRIVLNIEDKTRYLIQESVEWRTKHAVTYELILPPTTIEDAKKIMQEDLKRYFDLTVIKEKRITKCLVLKSKGVSRNAISNGDKSETNLYDDDPSPKYLHNYPISALIQHLNNYSRIPVIDETSFTENINIELPADPLNIPLLQAALKRYGFDLVEENREIDFYILSENKN
jgi:hypothetical protein